MQRSSPRLSWMAVAVMLPLILLSTACSPRPVVKPETPKPVPVECRREAIEQSHPANFRDPPPFDGLTDEEQDRAMLDLRAQDFAQYRALRALAVRCAE